ncbi:MAG: hypothetical protein F6J90_06930 [Moorea sp. SIOASIH]|uniref:hypothetical protein n=1 Tax=Moorena sp. SIOASIH TaxID=2607817 RepID=UPI0013BCFF68|nr:hypothetical protein [Moorena sp. SIOASIH]NEO36071.1 hypothetical protein [Moorena sp. SIOASIH]
MQAGHWNGHQGWNGHLGGTGILPVSIYFQQAGYLPHSYLSKDSAMPRKPKAKSKEGFKRCIPDSRLPIPYSLLPTPYSLLPTPCAIDSIKKIPSEENYGHRDAP